MRVRVARVGEVLSARQATDPGSWLASVMGGAAKETENVEGLPYLLWLLLGGDTTDHSLRVLTARSCVAGSRRNVPTYRPMLVAT